MLVNFAIQNAEAANFIKILYNFMKNSFSLLTWKFKDMMPASCSHIDGVCVREKTLMSSGMKQIGQAKVPQSPESAHQ